ncbi:hypothetical protein [Streptomyces sp. NPDC001068]|uniref:hypothetical protein n=1 Tax=Streptomyces sp. NPDC001068 TaxID=3364544 RepID=UPI003689262E
MKRVRLGVVTASVLLAANPVVAGSAAAVEDDTGTVLPVAGFSSLMVDPVHDRLFLSGGSRADKILVTDLSGAEIGEIADEPGATKLALSPDSTTLYALLPDQGAISAVDTTTLSEVARYDTGGKAGTADRPVPASLAFSAGRIWFTYTQGDSGGLGSLDPADPAAPATRTELGRGYAVQASPEAPGTLAVSLQVAGHPELDVVDVATGTPRITAHAPGVWSSRLAITPDGQGVATDGNGVLRLADLSRDTDYSSFPAGGSLNSFAFASDGTMAVGNWEGMGSSVHESVTTLSAQGTQTLRSYSFPDFQSTGITVQDIAWTPDGSRLLSVIDTMGTLRLHELTRPRAAQTSMAVTYDDLTLNTGTAVPETGRVNSSLRFPTGALVHISRTDAAHPGGVVLPDAPLTPDGGFAVRDTPPGTGTYTYQVRYPGDADHLPSQTTATIRVAKVLGVATDAGSYAYGATAKATAHLSVDFKGAKVSLYAQPAGAGKRLLKSGTVDSSGNLTASYQVTRDTTFTAVFAGAHDYYAATATRSAGVHASVHGSLSGYYTTTSYGNTSYRVYHHTAKQKYTVTVAPAKPGACVRLLVQHYHSGSWQTSKDLSCVRLNATSGSTYSFSYTGPTGDRFRVRAESDPQGTDTANSPTWSGWSYFTIRT